MTPLQIGIANTIVREAEARLRELVACHERMNLANATLETEREVRNNISEAQALQRAMLPAIRALTTLDVPTPPPATYDEVAASRKVRAEANMQSHRLDPWAAAFFAGGYPSYEPRSPLADLYGEGPIWP